MLCPECNLDGNAEVCQCGFEFVVQDFEERTRPFRLLYEEVTKRLTDVADHLPPKEGAWLRWLIQRFWDSHLEWQSRDLRVAEYLYRFHSGYSPRALRVMGHAYLHIAYDLPRDIDRSFTGAPYADDGIPVPINQAEAIYRHQNHLFLDMMEDVGRRYEVMGVYALPGYVLPKQLCLYHNLGYWITTIRLESWDHAMLLNGAAGWRKDELTDQIIEAINRASKAVVGQKLNPFSWPGQLRSPELMPAIILLLQAQFIGQLDRLPWIVATLVAFVILWPCYRYVQLFRTCNLLGRAVSEEVKHTINRRRFGGLGSEGGDLVPA